MIYVYEWRWGNRTDEWVTEETYVDPPEIDQAFFDGVTQEDTAAMADYEADQSWCARIRNTNTDEILFHKEVRGSL